MKADLLIVGGSGFVGGRTAQSAMRAGLSVAVTTNSRPAPPGAQSFTLDVGDQDALAECLIRCRPRAVIYSVLSWELHSLEAQMRLSADGLRSLITAMRRAGLQGDVPARLVYISTNAVFSGARGPYSETDIPDPQHRTDAYRHYGAARRAGEVIALNEWADALVVRTSNVDGRDAWGTVNRRLSALVAPLRAGEPLPRYVDRVISPTLVDDLADGLVEAIAPDFRVPQSRVLHLAGSEPASDYQFARRLAIFLGCDPELVREDHYLPPGEEGTYNIALDIAAAQSLLKTRLRGLQALFQETLA